MEVFSGTEINELYPASNSAGINLVDYPLRVFFPTQGFKNSKLR